MKSQKLIVSVVLVVVCLSLVVLSGCNAGADALLTFEAKVLPNHHAYIGKDASKVAEKELEGNVIRTAMNNRVITTSDELSNQLNTLGL